MEYDSALTGIVCTICKVYGKPPVQARGAWVKRHLTIVSVYASKVLIIYLMKIFNPVTADEFQYRCIGRWDLTYL